MRSAVGTLLGWLTLAVASAAGAAPPAQPARLPTPQEAVTLALADVRRQPETGRKYLRYLWVGHIPATERQEVWQVLCGHVNSLSRMPRIAHPVIVLDTGHERAGLPTVANPLRPAMAKEEWPRATLLRLDITEYRWDATVWEQLAGADFHFHARLVKEVTVTETVMQEYGYWRMISTQRQVTSEYAKANPKVCEWIRTEDRPVKKEMKKQEVVTAHAPWLPAATITALATETHSDVPILLADFFLWQTAIMSARKPGYADFLGFKDKKTFDALVGFDQAKAEVFTFELLAAVADSGVSEQPRRIARFDKIGGAYWITFDSKLARGKSNPLENIDRKDFAFDASEVIAHLPNGWMACGLFDNKGVRQDSAPDFVGHDKTTTSNNGRIENALSCYRCHQKGMLQDIDDWQRNLYQPPISLSGPDKEKIIEAQQLWLRSLIPALKADRDRYEAAVLEATGLDSGKYSAALRNRWMIYADAPTAVDRERAAREVGVSEAELTEALTAFHASPFQPVKTTAVYTLPPARRRRIPIDQYHELHQNVQQAVFAWRAIKGMGGKLPDRKDAACLDYFREHRGAWPSADIAGKMYGWEEACKEAGFDAAKWPPMREARIARGRRP